MADRFITVFGGSGFVGRHLVNKLADAGWRVRVAVRDAEAAKFLKPLGELGQISIVAADVTNPDSVKAAVENSAAVVNLVGILYERGKATFQKVHVDAAGNVAQAARDAGVPQLLHMSALGADPQSDSEYARTKGEGEQKVREVFPEATIFRPSVIFGPEDDFYNRFAAMARLLPFLIYFADDAPRVVRGESGTPELDLYGEGGPKLQPVYVGDVAEAFKRVIEDKTLAGKTYELGGPTVYSLREIMQQVCDVTRRKRPVLPAPFWVAKVQAAFLQFLPKPPLTPDQVRLLRKDNVLSGTQPGLQDLGIQPELADAILPQYLSRFRKLHNHIRGARYRSL